MNYNPSGELTIRPLTANLKRDKDIIFKMDPYVKIVLGTQYQKTPVAWMKGKHPGWKDQLTFRRNAEDLITFEVWDKDILSHDDMIGVGAVAFSSVLLKGNRYNEWVPLTFKGKNAGELLVDISFAPDYLPQQQQQQGIGGIGTQQMYQQPSMYQQPIFYPQQQIEIKKNLSKTLLINNLPESENYP